MTTTLYQEKADPPFNELVTLDKWFQPLSVPIRRAKKNSEGMFVKTGPISFAPDPGSDLIGPDYFPIFTGSRSPQRNEPLGYFTKPLEPSLFTSMSVVSLPSVRMRGKKKRFQYQTFVRPLEPSLVVVPDLESWHRQQSEPLPIARRVAQTFFITTFEQSAETITIDKWHGSQVIPVRRKNSLDLGMSVEPFDQFTVSGEISWYAQQSFPVRSKRIPVPETSVEPFDQFAIGGSLAWYAQHPAPQKVATRQFVGLVQTLFDQAAILDWSGQQTAPLFRTKAVQSQLQFTFTEATPAITLDWLSQQSTPVARKRAIQSQPQFIFAETPAVTVDWLVQQISPISRKPRTFGWSVVPEQITVAPVTLDEWWRPTETPPRAKMRTVPSEMFFTSFIAPTIEPPCPYRPETTDEPDKFDLSNDFGFAYLDSVTDITIEASRADDGEERHGRVDEGDSQPGRKDECS